VASREGHYEIVKALLENKEKPDVNATTDTVCDNSKVFQFFQFILYIFSNETRRKNVYRKGDK